MSHYGIRLLVIVAAEYGRPQVEAIAASLKDRLLDGDVVGGLDSAHIIEVFECGTDQ